MKEMIDVCIVSVVIGSSTANSSSGVFGFFVTKHVSMD